MYKMMCEYDMCTNKKITCKDVHILYPTYEHDM